MTCHDSLKISDQRNPDEILGSKIRNVIEGNILYIGRTMVAIYFRYFDLARPKIKI